MPTAIRL